MSLADLPPFRLERRFSKWEFAARHNLCASDAESWSVGELLELAGEAACEEFLALPLGYSPTWGAPELRTAIAALYDRVSDQQILAFTGAEEAVFVVCHALLEPGDHAVVVVPTYQSLDSVPRSLCQVSNVLIEFEPRPKLDIEALFAACRANTKALVLNFPNNPTGAALANDELTEIVAFARHRGIWLISDEVYRGLERSGAAAPPATDVYERAVSIGVMSKSFGLPGLRVGWAATPDTTLLSKMESLKHYLTICGPAPSERLAALALEARDQILARNRTIVETNVELLEAFMADHDDMFEWASPDAGCVAFPRLRSGSADDFCDMLVERHGVLLMPGSAFQSSGGVVPGDRFRIGFGRRDFSDGLGAMASALASPRSIVSRMA